MRDDELFDKGIFAGEDFLVKAQLKLRVRPLRLPAAQDIVDKLDRAYEDRLDLLATEIEAVLKGAPLHKSLGLYIVPGGLGSDMFKAVEKDAPPKTPKANISGQQRAAAGHADPKAYRRKEMDTGRAGSRGGKWYLDARGKVRYGTKPSGEFTQEASPEQVAEHLQHYRPIPLLGGEGVSHEEFIKHISDPAHAAALGFTETDREFLDHWYGGQLADFKADFDLTDEDLSGDLGKLEVRHDDFTGGQWMPYEQAVVNYLRDNYGWGEADFDGEVKPALDELFERYHKALKNPAVLAKLKAVGEDVEKTSYEFFVKAAEHEEVMENVAELISANPDPNVVATNCIAALGELGVLFTPKKGETKQAAQLKGKITPDVNLVSDDKDEGYLLGAGKDRLDHLSNAQLMTLYIGANLQAVHDGEGQYHVSGAAPWPAPRAIGNVFPASDLAEHVLDLLRKKAGLGQTALGVLRQRLDDASVGVAKQLNDANGGVLSTTTRDVLEAGASVLSDPEKLQKLQAKARELMDLRESALEAQKNDTFALPKSMADGLLGAEHQKKPLPHQVVNPEKDPERAFRLFQHQKQALNWMATTKRGLLALDAGMGKGLPLDEPVLTPTGFQPIGSLLVGDSVSGKDGLPTTVLGVFPQGVRECYRVSFSDDTYVNCDINHVWTVKMGLGERSYWGNKTMQEILDESWENADGRKKFAVPIVEPVHFQPCEELKIDPYELGLLLGDGSLQQGDVTFWKPEEDLQDVWRKKYDVTLGAVTEERSCPKLRIKMAGSGLALHKALAFYGLLGTDAATKFIPSAYLRAPVDARLWLLRGLIDTAGSVLGGTVIDYSTVSKKLAEDVTFLARSLGALVRKSSRFTHYTYKGERLRGQRSYRLQMRFLNGLVPVQSAKHLAKYKPNEHNAKEKRIVDVERVDDQETVCIKVAASDGLFVTRGFTVTHNTPTVVTFMEHLKEQGKAKRAILFLPPSLMSQWPDEIANFAPGAKNKILNLSGLSLEERKMALQSDLAKNAEYILISTGTLSGPKDQPQEGDKPEENDGTGGTDDELTSLLQGLDGAVFIDEVHQGGFKTGSSVRHKIAKAVIGDREHAFGMTATPMPNHPLDLFHLTNLFAPGTVGTSEEWEGDLHGVQFNELTNKWDVANPENLKKLKDRIKPFVLHKLITDPAVVKDMETDLGTPLQPNSDVTLSPNHPIHEYLKPGGHIDKFVEDRIEALQKGRRDRGEEPYGDRAIDSMRKLLPTNLHRLCAISPELIPFDPPYKGRSPKIDKMVSDIVDHFKGGGGTVESPIVIFSSFPEGAFHILKRELAAAGVDPSLIGEIHGGKSSRERAYEQDMTNAGKRKILLVGTMSGGAGLNLQKASHKVMFLDEPWHPAAKRQAMGRVWRTGQKHAVQLHTYRLMGSYDEKIEMKLAGKQVMVSAMLGDVDPTSLDFGAAAEAGVALITGQEMKKRRQSKRDRAKDLQAAASIKEFYGEEFRDIPEVPDNEADIPDIDKRYNEQYYQYLDKTKHERLKADAPHLANFLSHTDEWQSWNQSQKMKNAKQNYGVKMMVAKVAEKAGDTEKADRAKRSAGRVTTDYVTGFLTKVAEAAHFKKEGHVKEAQQATKDADKLAAAFPEAKCNAARVAWEKAQKAKEKPQKKEKPAPVSKPSKPKPSKPLKNPFSKRGDQIAYEAHELLSKKKPTNKAEALKHLTKLLGKYVEDPARDARGLLRYLAQNKSHQV